MCMCVCARALSHQTLGDPRDYSPPGSSVMEFYRQEYWSGLPFPTPEDLPNPGTEPVSLASLELAGRFFTTASLGKPAKAIILQFKKKKKRKNRVRWPFIQIHFILSVPICSCYVCTIQSTLEVNFTPGLCQVESKETVSGLYIRQRFGQNEAWGGLWSLNFPFAVFSF